jgi:hypothetical protein
LVKALRSRRLDSDARFAFQENPEAISFISQAEAITGGVRFANFEKSVLRNAERSGHPKSEMKAAAFSLLFESSALTLNKYSTSRN